MRLNLVTLCGQQVTTLEHMLGHYRDLVDEIFVIVHRLAEDDPIEREVETIAQEIGCGVYTSVVADHFDPAFATELYNQAMRERPDEWWIIADPDELHLYFEDVQQILRECEAKGWSFVGGHFLDRCGPGGTLPELDDSDIWRQFPLTGLLRSEVTRAPGWKICLAKGTVELVAGQHFVAKRAGIVGYPIERGLVQVHHFKWDSTVLARHLNTLSTLKSKIDLVDDGCQRTYRTMYDYLLNHDGRINVADPRFFFVECPEPLFPAYPHWPPVATTTPPSGLLVDWP